MKKYLILICSFVYSIDAIAYNYSSDSTVSSFDDTEIVVDNGVVISADGGGDILMNTPVYLYNNGTINGVLNTNGYNLFIYNNGTMNYDIINTGGNITQIITPYTGIKNIVVPDGNYVVRIEDVPNLNFLDIKNITPTFFEITNTSGNHTTIIINDFAEWQAWNKIVKISEPISLRITDENALNYDGEVVGNIITNTDAIIDVWISGMDDSDRVGIEKMGTQFKLDLSRVINYDIIFGKENTALERLRKSNPNDRLIRALDLAHNTNEINQIKNKSYRFNHNILLRPGHVVNDFALMDNIKHRVDYGLGIQPVYMMSDKISNMGGRIYIGNHYNDLYFSVGLNLNRFEYRDYVNDFSGFMYGTDIALKQYFNKLWVNGVGGINLTRFNANYITSNNEIKNNPFGLSWYMGVDTGYDFDIGNDFILTPFVGTAYQMNKVADVYDEDFYIRSGAGLKYFFAIDGIKYEYELDGAIASNGSLFSTLKVGFWSITDEAGASLGVGVLNNDFGLNYQLLLNAKMLF